MSGGGKGGKTSTSLPSWVAQPAERNIQRAEEAAQIGYVPYYGPSVAAFSPMQQQGFANLGAMGSAFGLAPQGQMFQPTMQAQDFGNGLQGYSSGSLYDLALAEIQQRRPGQADAINGMFLDPFTGRPAAPQAVLPKTPEQIAQEERDRMAQLASSWGP